LAGDPLAPSWRMVDKGAEALRTFARRWIDPCYRPLFAEVASKVGSDAGRETLKRLHLDHLETLELAARALSAGRNADLRTLAARLSERRTGDNSA
jgi:hypothetical protein